MVVCEPPKGKLDILAFHPGAPRSWESGFWEHICSQKSKQRNATKGILQSDLHRDSTAGNSNLCEAPCFSWACLEIVFSQLSPMKLARARVRIGTMSMSAPATSCIYAPHGARAPRAPQSCTCRVLACSNIPSCCAPRADCVPCVARCGKHGRCTACVLSAVLGLVQRGG